MVISNVVLERAPVFAQEGEISGQNPQFAAMLLITKLLWSLKLNCKNSSENNLYCIIIIIINYFLMNLYSLIVVVTFNL